MNWKWMLECILIYATASELCVASVLRQKMNVVPNEAEGHSEHFREIRQQKCPPLEIENAAAPCPEANPNEVCTITCNDNSDIEGEATVKCETTGEWSRTQPKCIIKTCPPLEIDNATAPCPETNPNEVCTITCNDNSDIQGEATVKCETNGRWSATQPKCILKKCPPLQIENATSPCPETNHNEDCAITCNANYDIQGKATVKCETNGQWSTPHPKCILKRIRCPVLQIINASKDPACSESYPDQECTVTCQDKFDLDGEDKIKCESTGNWSREPKCNLTEGTQSRGTSGQRLTKITNNNNFCKDCVIINS